MKLDIKVGLVTAALLLTTLFYVFQNKDDKYDVRPTALLIELVSVKEYQASLPRSGGWYGSADVVQSDPEGRLSGWFSPFRGHLTAYSARQSIDQVFMRQMGINRPDVELAKGGDKRFRYAGYDFKFDTKDSGQIECVVWTDGKYQDMLWLKPNSRCK